MNFSEPHKHVFELSETIMDNSKYVYLNKHSIERLAIKMLQSEKRTKINMPSGDVYKGVLLELIATSIEYCYWYGRSDIRPCRSNSDKMYELLFSSFENYIFSKDINLGNYLQTFWISLCSNRFPLLEERAKHLQELLQKNTLNFVETVVNHRDVLGFDHAMSTLLYSYPGFAADQFLKRASLFFIQLYRKYGWFETSLENLHIPADYQIPKVLHYYKCLEYSKELEYNINNSILIPKGSLMECEIRAATILAAKSLCILTNWNVADVDTYLFLKRHKSTNPFHLTITTDY